MGAPLDLEGKESAAHSSRARGVGDSMPMRTTDHDAASICAVHPHLLELVGRRGLKLTSLFPVVRADVADLGDVELGRGRIFWKAKARLEIRFVCSPLLRLLEGQPELQCTGAGQEGTRCARRSLQHNAPLRIERHVAGVGCRLVEDLARRGRETGTLNLLRCRLGQRQEHVYWMATMKNSTADVRPD